MGTPQRSVVGLVVALVTAVLVWWTQGDGGAPAPEPSAQDSATTSASASPTHDYTETNTRSAEYTVPTPGSDDRGARRIVAGDEGELYWTGDHYRSFERITR
jgi:ribonuclease T1